MRIISAWLLSLSLVASAASKSSKSSATVESIHQLNADNFDVETSRGLWMVEHYSPGCGHCRAFAPTYEKLSGVKKDYEATRGFFLGQVNCQAQGDLCNDHDIKYYPQIKLYQDGVAIDQYDGDRSFDQLSVYIDEKSKQYVRSLPMQSERISNKGGSVDTDVNPEGISKDLEAISLASAIAAGPVFVKFYAPWCGHCKKLAPTWTEFAQSMKGKLNVAEVNCAELQALCKAEDVRGFPSLILYHHGRKEEFVGARKVESMQEFVETSIAEPEIKVLETSDLSTLIDEHTVFFVFLQTYSTTDSDLSALKDVMQSTLNPVPIYTSRDPDLFAAAGIKSLRGSALICYKDHLSNPVAALSLPSSGSETKSKLAAFYQSHKQPTVTELTTSNYEEIMKSPTRALIVLAALKRTGKGTSELEKDIEKLETVARAWRKGGRGFVQPVWFVWVDGIKWRKWLRQSLGIKKNALPQVVLMDPIKSEYYDMTLEKTPLQFEGASIFSTLEGVYQHHLTPKYIETALERGSRSLSGYFFALTEIAISNPIAAMLVAAAIVSGIIYGLQCCITRDLDRSGASSRLD